MTDSIKLVPNPLMGWESSSDTLSELKLEFTTKEMAINYAKKKKIDFEPVSLRKTILKNFVTPIQTDNPAMIKFRRGR